MSFPLSSEAITIFIVSTDILVFTVTIHPSANIYAVSQCATPCPMEMS